MSLNPFKKKQCRPQLYTEKEKKKIDIERKRIRQQAQAAARRQNLRFKIYTADYQIIPQPVVESPSWSLGDARVLEDTPSSDVTLPVDILGSPPNEPLTSHINPEAPPISSCTPNDNVLFDTSKLSKLQPEYDEYHAKSGIAVEPLRPPTASAPSRPYKSIYPDLNPPRPQSPSPELIDPIYEEAVFDSGHATLMTLTISLTHNDSVPGCDEAVQLGSEETSDSVVRSEGDVPNEAINKTEGSLGRPQRDSTTGDQNKGRDSDFEFMADDVEIDSDSDGSVSLEDVDVNDPPENTTQSNYSSAKEFLQNTWNRLCDYEVEERSLASGRREAFTLRQMAEYWKNCNVPDTISSSPVSSEDGDESHPHLDWFSILSGREQRPV